MNTNLQFESDDVLTGRMIASMQKISSSGRVVTGDAILSELSAAGQTRPGPHGRFRYNTGRPYTGSHPLLTGKKNTEEKEKPEAKPS